MITDIVQLYYHINPLNFLQILDNESYDNTW